MEWEIASHFPEAKWRRCYIANSNKVLSIPARCSTVSPAPRRVPTAEGSYSRTTNKGEREEGEREGEEEKREGEEGQEEEEEEEREGGGGKGWEREGRKKSTQLQQDTRTFSSKQTEVRLNCYFLLLMDHLARDWAKESSLVWIHSQKDPIAWPVHIPDDYPLCIASSPDPKGKRSSGSCRCHHRLGFPFHSSVFS